MGKTLRFELSDRELEFVLEPAIRREELYGSSKRVVVDREGKELKSEF